MVSSLGLDGKGFCYAVEGGEGRKYKKYEKIIAVDSSVKDGNGTTHLRQVARVNSLGVQSIHCQNKQSRKMI